MERASSDREAMATAGEPVPRVKVRVAIPVRAPRFDLSEVPREWLAGSSRASTIVNALSLIFPEGERFFIRAVKDHEAWWRDDPELTARVRGFFGQEGRHGHEHDRMNRMLEAHGYEVEGFLRWYSALAYERIEPMVPPHLRLATTVALEHMTSTLAEVAFTTEVLDDAHPSMRALLLWHATEEIEHKSVTWDVLERVDPSMRTRVAGFAIASAVLGLFWSTAYAMLLRQERALPRPETRPDPAVLERFRRGVRRGIAITARAVGQYLRPDFHPDEHDNSALARDYVALAGLAPAG